MTIQKIYYSLLTALFIFSTALFFTQKNWMETRRSKNLESLPLAKQEDLKRLFNEDRIIRSKMREIVLYGNDYNLYSDLLHETTENNLARAKIWSQAEFVQSPSRVIYTTLGVIE